MGSNSESVGEAINGVGRTEKIARPRQCHDAFSASSRSLESCACCSSESELASAESSEDPIGPAATLCFSSCSTYAVHSRKKGPKNFASAFLCFLNSSLRRGEKRWG